MGVQREQVGAEHTALGGSGVQHLSGGGVTTSPNRLGSVCEEVQYPECGTQAQSAEYGQFHGEIVLNAKLKSTNTLKLNTPDHQSTCVCYLCLRHVPVVSSEQEGSVLCLGPGWRAPPLLRSSTT